jgi:hypothetical protein
MNAPTKITVGHLVWKLRLVNETKMREIAKPRPGVTQYGLTAPESLEFFILVSLDPGQFLDTVVHELVHTLWITYGWKARLNQEELASMLPCALTRLYLDNPKLCTWLKQLAR